MSDDNVVGMLAGRHKLRIGDSFAPSNKYSYHALRYDFKPASIDPNSPSSLIINGNEVTVIPDGEKSQTVFKGNKKPCQKEGILIFDPATGECTLERLNSVLQVKKSRDGAPKPAPQLATHSEASMDSSPKRTAPTGAKQPDPKRLAPTAPVVKKASPAHPGPNVPKQSQNAAQSSAPKRNTFLLKEDLNLSESSDDD